jgi:hypothetical protein
MFSTRILMQTSTNVVVVEPKSSGAEEEAGAGALSPAARGVAEAGSESVVIFARNPTGSCILRQNGIDLAKVEPTAWNRASIDGFYKLNHKPLCEVIAGALFSGARRG